MKNFLILLLLLTQSPLCWAELQQKDETLNDGSTISRVLYPEADRFVVDTFKVGIDGWQEREEQKTFSTLEKAQAYFDEQTRFSHTPTLAKKTFSVARATVPVWPVHRQWDAQWEGAYNRWVKSTITTTYFFDNQVPTDCADVAFAARWIFARINGLPAAATMFTSGKLFTQDDGKEAWGAIPTAANWQDDQRFRTALQYVFENTFTHTLLNDSYPVEVSPAGVQPGGYYLVLRPESGHTRLINNTQPNSSGSKVISFVASDVPAKIRKLNAEPFSLRKPLDQSVGGFLRFRWPQQDAQGKYTLVDGKDMPFYSLEQYLGDFLTAYYKTVTTHMGITDSPEDYLKMHLDIVWQRLQARIPIVQEGYQICSVEDCSPDSENYENWGTPNRDGTTVESVNEVYRTLWGYPKDKAVIAEFARWKDKIVEVDKGIGVRFQGLLDVWYYNLYSYDPRDSILKRWGLKEPTAKTPTAVEQETTAESGSYDDNSDDFWGDFWDFL